MHQIAAHALPLFVRHITERHPHELSARCVSVTDQTLFQCVNDFVKPKLGEVNRDIERLRGDLQRADGGSNKQREMLEELEDFSAELKEFHDELLRVAGLPYKPNLNDGVLITASPLWKLFRLPKWQKELKACWEAMEKADYE